MQRKNIFLTLIIPGPNYPGKNMNVYMQPLKDKFQENSGTVMYASPSQKEQAKASVALSLPSLHIVRPAAFVSASISRRSCKACLEKQSGRMFRLLPST